MTNKNADGSSIGSGTGSRGPGTFRGDGPDIPSGFSPMPPGTFRGGSGPNVLSGFTQGQSGTLHAGGPGIPSGFGLAIGALAGSFTKGDPVEINDNSYTFERVLSNSTREAEIFLLRLQGTLCVFKLYYPNFKPKDEVLAPLKQLRHEDIINVIDYGYFHDRFFEIMEYAEGGTLEQYLPIRDPERLRKIVSEVVNAFKFCHDRNIVHKDIKPGNLFYKSADGTDIVIGDFGISSSLDSGMTRVLTSQSLTVGYAAPEMYGIGGKFFAGREVDYYALGITLIHLWTGKSPFDDLGIHNIHAIANLTNIGAIKIPDDLPKEFQTIIRGLITIDYTKRWGYAEVQRWLNGEEVPVHFHVKEITYPPFHFDVREKVATPEALASLLKVSRDKGKKLLYSGKISAWANVFDHALSNELDHIVEVAYPKDQEAGLQKAIYILNPDEPYAQNERECRSREDLAAELDDGFSFYVDSLTNPNHQFYLYLEAHQAQMEADTFRLYFKTFSAKKALNTVILELRGRESFKLGDEVFRNPEELLDYKDKQYLVNELKDRESILSLWVDGTTYLGIRKQLDTWRGLKKCDETTLAFIREAGDGPPTIELSKASFSYDDLRLGHSSSNSFTISNIGGGSLSGAIKSDKKWLKVTQSTIDSNQRTQKIDYTVDTGGLPFGFKETGTIEILSNVGPETFLVSISTEQGIKAATRFRAGMAFGGGALGALVGLIVYSWATDNGNGGELFGMAGILGIIGILIVSSKIRLFIKNNNPTALIVGLTGAALLRAYFPMTFSVMGWAFLLGSFSYFFAPSVLRNLQVGTKPAIVGLAMGAIALSVATILMDFKIAKLGNTENQSATSENFKLTDFVGALFSGKESTGTWSDRMGGEVHLKAGQPSEPLVVMLSGIGVPSCFAWHAPAGYDTVTFKTVVRERIIGKPASEWPVKEFDYWPDADQCITYGHHKDVAVTVTSSVDQTLIAGWYSHFKNSKVVPGYNPAGLLSVKDGELIAHWREERLPENVQRTNQEEEQRLATINNLKKESLNPSVVIATAILNRNIEITLTDVSLKGFSGYEEFFFNRVTSIKQYEANGRCSIIINGPGRSGGEFRREIDFDFNKAECDDFFGEIEKARANWNSKYAVAWS